MEGCGPWLGGGVQGPCANPHLALCRTVGVEHMECEIKLEASASPDRDGGADLDSGKGLEDLEECKKRKRKPYRPGECGPGGLADQVPCSALALDSMEPPLVPPKPHLLLHPLQGSVASWCGSASLTRVRRNARLCWQRRGARGWVLRDTPRMVGAAHSVSMPSPLPYSACTPVEGLRSLSGLGGGPGLPGLSGGSQVSGPT